MELGYNEVWAPTLQEENRERITMLLSQDSPSSGQDPCSVVPLYENAGINFINLAFGDASNGMLCDGLETTVRSNEMLFFSFCFAIRNYNNFGVAQ